MEASRTHRRWTLACWGQLDLTSHPSSERQSGLWSRDPPRSCLCFCKASPLKGTSVGWSIGSSSSSSSFGRRRRRSVVAVSASRSTQGAPVLNWVVGRLRLGVFRSGGQPRLRKTHILANLAMIIRHGSFPTVSDEN